MKDVKKSEGEYIDLRGAKLAPFKNIQIERLERMAKIIRGLIFVTVENAQSGHPGGSSSKVEQFLALTLGGSLVFDPAEPKHPGRDRMIWSAGHCTPLLFGGQALYYEALRRTGRQFSEAVIGCVLPEQLLRFRRSDGLPGHAESTYPFCDYSTGPSGHGFSAALGIALSHHSSALSTKVWVMMGDAESEEGMTYEARNVAVASGIDNIIVSLDYNHFGIDGPIEEAMAAPYTNLWHGFGWNVIEVDGHNINELLYAYDMARKGFKNNRPTVVIAHTIKGKEYGKLSNTPASHGSPIVHDEYIKLMRKLGFSINGDSDRAADDLETILESLKEEDCEYIEKRFAVMSEKLEAEPELIERMKKNLKNRKFVDPCSIERPKALPPELVFNAGDNISLRHAAGAWFAWLMKQTAFFYAGAGDLSGSTGTKSAEQVYGIINAKNPFGRGVRYGIAEQNMAMMSMALTQDILPGDFKPVSVFGTYGVFTAMYGHAMHLALINNAINPRTAGFFIALATHDGPETGEDGPTHQGMYWMSLFSAYPGIKVLKPSDANETIETLFGALKNGEPVVLALPREKTPVLKRSTANPASAANDGAYILSAYKNSGGKKITIAVCGPKMIENVLNALPQITKQGIDVKVVAVTSPQLFSDLVKVNPKKAEKIISESDKKDIVTVHNGWKGFLDPIFLTHDSVERRIGVDKYLKSGSASEVIALAGLDMNSLAKKIIEAV
ncbi:MAG: thiamine pyrophosphate-dependent enzyme [Candidatus Magasanikbacteria bacterium]|nr:thiamine pyrophosphate-dependent enzyme [Candidatus Magasanikbacteria bacterium]